MPKFQTLEIWQQAEVLMQPAFIRLIANIGKQLEQSTWKGEYADKWVWAEGVDEATKAEVMQLRSQLEAAEGDQVAEIDRALAQLPAPYPGYQLCLTQADQQVCVDLWELCYQICFRDYDSESGTSWTRGFGQPPSQSVEVDATLFDETGEVDWNRLDDKARKCVDRLFAQLPT